MSKYLRVNFGYAYLASTVTDVALSMTLTAGHNFPTSAGTFIVLIWDSVIYANPANDPNKEFVEVSYSAPNVYTIARAKESTTAVEHLTGSKCGIFYSAGVSTADLSIVGTKEIDETDIGNGKVVSYNGTKLIYTTPAGYSGYSGQIGVSGYSGRSGYSGIGTSGYSGINSSGKQLYTSGTGNWLCPTGVTQILYTIQAGGGGGAGGADTNGGGGGGGGGAKVMIPLTTTPGNNYAYVVGAGGQGGRWSVQNPTAGGNTTFNGDSVTGGGRGGTAISKEYGEAGGLGGDRYSGSKDGLAGIPSLPGTGFGGGNGATADANGNYSGAGGGSNFGTGGAGTSAAGNGNPGVGYGGGGSGSSEGNTGSYIGGAGTGGFVLIEW